MIMVKVTAVQNMTLAAVPMIFQGSLMEDMEGEDMMTEDMGEDMMMTGTEGVMMTGAMGVDMMMEDMVGEDMMTEVDMMMVDMVGEDMEEAEVDTTALKSLKYHTLLKSL